MMESLAVLFVKDEDRDFLDSAAHALQLEPIHLDRSARTAGGFDVTPIDFLEKVTSIIATADAVIIQDLPPVFIRPAEGATLEKIWSVILTAAKPVIVQRDLWELPIVPEQLREKSSHNNLIICSNMNEIVRQLCATASPRITVYGGPMYAGKTTKLFSLVVNSVSTYVTSSILDRDQSHAGATISTLTRVANLMDFTSSEAFHQHKVLLIDEAQFFNDLIQFAKYAIDKGKILHVAGLWVRVDDVPFGQVLELAGIADRIVQLLARCEVCNRAASFTSAASTEDMKVIEEGVRATGSLTGDHHYSPRCRKHK